MQASWAHTGILASALSPALASTPDVRQQVPLERQNELCLEIVFETFMTLGMIMDAGVTGEYLFYELPKPAGGFPSWGMTVVLVKVERSRFYCRLRLTSPHG